jgi:integral membrane protein (TIGR01906 family)
VGGLLVILALAVLPLLAPPLIHAALDAAGSSDLLGLPPGAVHELSDRSVSELVLGTGSFAFEGPDGEPFFDAQERRHLSDARSLLWLCLVAGAISGLGLAGVLGRSSPAGRALIWRQIGRAGATAAVAVIILAILSLVAFGTLFTLFHQVFFPAGGWAFDPAKQRLVQLYPVAFWQIMAAAYGSLVLVVSLGAWILGRSRSASAVGLSTADPTHVAEGR